MEFAQGKTLKQIAETRARSSTEYIRNALLYMRLVCEALRFMHKAGYIHGDIRPDNILAGEQGLKLIDFGFSTKIGEPVELKGTPEYLAPEELYSPYFLSRYHRNNPFTKTRPSIDIYNFGRTFYEFLGGIVQPVIAVNSKQEVLDMRTDQNFIKNLRTFPENLETSVSLHLQGISIKEAKILETLLEKCLIPHPAKRFQTIEEVTRAIEETEKLLKLA